MVNNLPAKQETWVQSLGLEDPLEKWMLCPLLQGDTATPSSIRAWRSPCTEEPGGLQSTRSQRVGHDWSDLACMHAWSSGGASIPGLSNPSMKQVWTVTLPGAAWSHLHTGCGDWCIARGWPCAHSLLLLQVISSVHVLLMMWLSVLVANHGT